MNASNNSLSWFLLVAVALSLAYASIEKFRSTGLTVEVFETLGMEPAGRYLIASLEALAAVLLLLAPSIAWGALLGWGIMSGSLIAHTTVIGVASDNLAAMTLNACFNWIACLVIMYLRRKDIGMINKMLEHKKESA